MSQRFLWVAIAAVVLAPVGSGAARSEQMLKAPGSIQAEHEEIHQDLVALTKASGPVGAAARELATALHPHFVREEEIALPPLGLLAPLAAGQSPAGMNEAAEMAETLKNEMPRMLAEHEVIRRAVEKLARVAEQEQNARAVAFARTLAHHARTEEEVLYPAAILIGEVVRTRLGR